MFFFFSSNQKLSLAQQQLQSDYEKLKAEEAEKSGKLQELMSVHVLNYERSIPSTNNTNKTINNQNNPSPVYIKKPKSETWAEFIPYKNLNIKNDNMSFKCCSKSQKDNLNNLTKLNKNTEYNMSVFHIHTLHLHLFISLTLILVTHKCPQYLVVI